MSANPGIDNGWNGRRPARRLWVRAWLAAAAALLFGILYFFVRQHIKDGVWRFDLSLVDKSLGVSALVLLTLSMFLTVLAYFSRGSGKLLAYRKSFGLVGFWTALAHGTVNHFLLPAVGLQSERGDGVTHAAGAGLAALIVFALMAVASDDRVRIRIGTERWRKLLRYAGYAGLVLGAGHVALLKWSSWTNFFRTFDPFLPSLSLPAAAFAAAAVLLRLAVGLSRRRKKP